MWWRSMLLVSALGISMGTSTALAQGPAMNVIRGGFCPSEIPEPRNGFAPIIQAVIPSVVNITSTRLVRSVAAPFPFLMDPQFWQLYGKDSGAHELLEELSQPKLQREYNVGSGVVVREDGYILTNHHVIDHAEDIRVALTDGRSFPAKVVGTDSLTDLAVLSIEASALPSMRLGDSSKIRVGDFAIAVGNQFGAGETVTMGIIGATGRAGSEQEYGNYIQTDAAINPGSSGGALVNMQGELIGINTAILSGTTGGGGQGLAFAVPVNVARGVLEQIMTEGTVHRGWLGLSLQPVTPEIASMFRLQGTPRGALVADTNPEGPSTNSGVSRGDIITAFNDSPVRDDRDLRVQIALATPGTSAKLTVFRDGEMREVALMLAETPSESQPEPEVVTIPENPDAPRFGLVTGPLTAETTSDLKLPANSRGVVIRSVQNLGAAEEAGLRPGDVIEEVNGKPVTSVEGFETVLEEIQSNRVLVLANRHGNRRFVVLSQR